MKSSNALSANRTNEELVRRYHDIYYDLNTEYHNITVFIYLLILAYYFSRELTTSVIVFSYFKLLSSLTAARVQMIGKFVFSYVLYK